MFGIATIAACWLWAGRLLLLPSEERVFRRPASARPRQDGFR